MSKRVAGVVLSSFIAGLFMNTLSFLFLERKSAYDTAFDPAHLIAMPYAQGVRYASDHTIELTGLDTLRAGRDDSTFWQNEVAYVLTYTMAGILACTCYLALLRLRRKSERNGQ
jgi:hypothetical protein